MSNVSRRTPHEAQIQMTYGGQISDTYRFIAGSSIEISLTSDGAQAWDGETTLQYLDEVTWTWETMTLTLPLFGAIPIVLTSDLPRVVSDPLETDVLVRYICTAAPSVEGEMSATSTILGYNSTHSVSLTVADSETPSSNMFGVKKYSRIAFAYTGANDWDGVIQIQCSKTAGSTWDTLYSFTGSLITGYSLTPPLQADAHYRIACVVAATMGSATVTLSEVVYTERVDPDTLCNEEAAERIAEDVSSALAALAEANSKSFAVVQDAVMLQLADDAAAARDVTVLSDADDAAAARDVSVLSDADAAAAARDVTVLSDADDAAAARDTAAVGAHAAMTAEAAHAENVVWKDLIGDVTKATSGALPPSLTGFIGGIQGWAFNSSNTDEVYIVYHVPHDVKPNTRMIPHFHWSPNDNAAGNVLWGFEYSYAKRDGGANDVFPATTTLTVAAATNSVAKNHIVTEIANGETYGILVTEPDGLILARLFRDGASGSDTYTGEAFLWTVDLHYQSDRYGTPSRDPDYYTP